jgi:hypothetical protein
MPTISVTNQKASQALRGEDVVVTLDATDQANLSSILPGQECSISGVAVYGTIARVDSYGISFEVSPLQPNLDFASPTKPGFLAASETIVITT